MRPAAVALDLDGVIWLAETPIPGAAEAVARLRASGVQVGFVTNNAFPTLAQHEAKLARHGIDATGSVIASPAAAATLIAPGRRVLVAGGPGVHEAVTARGAVAVGYDDVDGDGAAPVDAVMVGMHRDFDWRRLHLASRAVREGATFIATNDDATYPTDTGPVPGAGAIVAAIAVASGVAPVVAGKPHQPHAAAVRERLGPDGVVIGDRADTDGGLARALGWPFGLVLTGVTRPGAPLGEPAPDLVADDLAAMVDELLRS